MKLHLIFFLAVVVFSEISEEENIPEFPEEGNMLVLRDKTF